MTVYGFFWRGLPGPVWLRLIILTVILLVAVYICFEWVFPRIADYMPFNDGTVEVPT